MGSPAIHTYHCLCTSLLLSSTHTLSSLPRRASPSLDHAIILPLPPAPTVADSSNGEETASISELGYTLLLSMTPDRRVTLVRREDGFERRILHRCARCRLVVGYELDESHYADAKKVAGSDAMDVDAGARMKVVYLLPGGIMSTNLMAAGKIVDEAEIALGEIGKAPVAVWE